MCRSARATCHCEGHCEGHAHCGRAAVTGAPSCPRAPAGGTASFPRPCLPHAGSSRPCYGTVRTRFSLASLRRKAPRLQCGVAAPGSGRCAQTGRNASPRRLPGWPPGWPQGAPEAEGREVRAEAPVLPARPGPDTRQGPRLGRGSPSPARPPLAHSSPGRTAPGRQRRPSKGIIFLPN